MPLLSIKDILARSAAWLAEKGSPTARLDAELLLGHVLGMQRLELYLAWDRPLDEEEKERYRLLLKRRADHEPIAYITERKEFFGLPLRVTPAVLIPRPETELLVERVLELIRALTIERGLPSDEATHPTDLSDPSDAVPPDSSLPTPHLLPPTSNVELRTSNSPSPSFLLADIGTGSGAIAVALTHELPEARVVATDLSEAALAVARENAATHGVDERIAFRRTSLLSGVEGPFDIIASNPPYVAERDRGQLAPDVVRFEPHQALFAGGDGLDVIRALIPQAAERLCPGGWLVLEIGYDQAPAVAERLTADGRFDPADIRPDYQGIPRIVSARRR